MANEDFFRGEQKILSNARYATFPAIPLFFQMRYNRAMKQPRSKSPPSSVPRLGSAFLHRELRVLSAKPAFCSFSPGKFSILEILGKVVLPSPPLRRNAAKIRPHHPRHTTSYHIITEHPYTPPASPRPDRLSVSHTLHSPDSLIF